MYNILKELSNICFSLLLITFTLLFFFFFTLHSKKYLANLIKLGFWDEIILDYGWFSMYVYPCKKRAEGDLTQIEEKEAEVEVTWLQAKES